MELITSRPSNFQTIESILKRSGGFCYLIFNQDFQTIESILKQFVCISTSHPHT